MKLSDFEQDVTASLEGVWIDMEDEDGTSWLIARAGNNKHAKYIDRLYKPFKRLMDSDKLPLEKYQELNAKAAAKFILLGWKNFIGADGNAIPYSREKAQELLSDPKYEDLAKLINSLASEQETFKAQEEEELKETVVGESENS